MRYLRLTLISIAFLSLTIGAQTQPAQQDVYQLGTKLVRIPSPDGFVGTFGRFTRLRDRFLSTQGSGVSVVEVHVPTSVVKDLEKDEDIALSFYSRVSIPSESRIKDVTAVEFRKFFTDFEKQQSTLFDANGPVLRDATAQLRKGLKNHYGSETGLKMDQPTNLGYFQREPNVFSGMILMPLEIYGERLLLLAGFSFLHVKDRVVYVQMYRKFNDEKDAAILRDAVKTWTTSILAANK